MSEFKSEKYLNFPIQLLMNFIDETEYCLNNIWIYGLYRMTLEYEEGTEEEKIRSAKKYLGLEGGDNGRIYKKGCELYNSIPENSPMVGIKKSMYFDYYRNDKTDFEKACLLGFLAIKSILQKKSYCKIDNKFWLSRMDGKPKSIETSRLSPKIAQFSNHYQTRKIKDELVDGWKLKTYSHYTRGFYVSFNMELEKLIFEAEKRRKSTKKKKLKEREKNARLAAMEMLNN